MPQERKRAALGDRAKRGELIVEESTASRGQVRSASQGVLLGRVHRHLAAGEVDLAQSAFTKGRANFPYSGRMTLLEAQIREARGDADGAAGLFSRAAAELSGELEPTGTPYLAVALAQARMKSGDLEGAGKALELARARGAESVPVLRLERTLAFSRRDPVAMRRAAEALVASQADLDARDFVALAIACRDLGDLAAAAESARRARELDPSSLEAARIAASTAMLLGDVQTAIAAHRSMAELAPANPRVTFQLIRLLVLSGRVSQARDELDRALAVWPTDASLRAFALVAGFRSVEDIEALGAPADGGLDGPREAQLRRIAREAPSGEMLKRAPIVDDKTKDVVIGRARQSETGIIVFSALTDSVSMPLPIFDRYLAAIGATAVYLKDFQRLFYLNGVASLGASYGATITALRELCRHLEIRRLFTMGSSAGGFAAIRYGVELGAEGAASFAGETHDADRALTKIEPGVAMIRRRLAAVVPREELDLRQFLSSRRSSCAISLYYAGDAPRDNAQASHLCGLSGVTATAVAGCDDHELLRWLALNRDLSSILARVFASGAAAPPPA
jgi:tetratricopeptide (TPR) repeat protein